MKIGIDFDNTIICYDKVFKKISHEQKIFPKTLKKKRRDKKIYNKKI